MKSGWLKRSIFYVCLLHLTFEKCIIDGGVVVIGQFKTSIEIQQTLSQTKKEIKSRNSFAWNIFEIHILCLCLCSSIEQQPKQQGRWYCCIKHVLWWMKNLILVDFNADQKQKIDDGIYLFTRYWEKTFGEYQQVEYKLLSISGFILSYMF